MTCIEISSNFYDSAMFIWFFIFLFNYTLPNLKELSESIQQSYVRIKHLAQPLSAFVSGGYMSDCILKKNKSVNRLKFRY